MPPLWEKIYNLEKNILESNELKPGSLFHTVDSLARKHHVSSITSRHVLLKLIEDGLLKSLPRVGSIIVKPTLTTVYFLTPEKIIDPIANSTIVLFMKGIFDEARESGIKIIPVTEDFFRYPVTRESYLIYIYNLNHFTQEQMEQYASEKLHLCCLGSPDALKDIASISINSQMHTETIMQYLYNCCYRRIAYLGPVDSYWFAPRLAGYLKAHRSLNLPIDMSLIFQMEKKKDYLKTFNQLFALPVLPQAVLCVKNDQAYELLDYCKENSIGVPETIAITAIGNDFHPNACQKITTVGIQEEEAGRQIVKLISHAVNRRLWSPKNKTMPSIITPGDTVATTSYEI